MGDGVSGRRVFLTAEWRKLLMAQYVVDPAVLAPWLPRGVELDLFDGQCFVSLVGFLFDRVRVLGVPFPFHTQFPEVNLRFYVRQGARRGVVFVREYVPRMAITVIANTLYEEPYETLEMGYSWVDHAESRYVEYGWKKGRDWHIMGADAALTSQPIAPGSVEEFITEHYWGFTKRRKGYTSQYEVQHPRWECYPVQSIDIRADFGALYGPAFAGLDAGKPASALLAEGSAVSVRTGSRLAER